MQKSQALDFRPKEKRHLIALYIRFKSESDLVARPKCLGIEEAKEAVCLTMLAWPGQEFGYSQFLRERPSSCLLDKFGAAHLESQKRGEFSLHLLGYN